MVSFSFIWNTNDIKFALLRNDGLHFQSNQNLQPEFLEAVWERDSHLGFQSQLCHLGQTP